MKRFIAAVVAILLCLSVLSGCGNLTPGDQEEIDINRTQLWVGNYDGGYGDAWLYKLKARFEEKYKDVSFESGKTGVQVMIDSNKTSYSGGSLASIISGATQEVFFTELVFYYDYVSQGKFLDITDVVTESMEEYGETGTIEDKLTEDQKAYYKTGGKYYALPHYEAFEGLIYNVEMFDKNLWYFAKDKNNGNDGFIIDQSDEKSYGPDGKTGVIEGIDYSKDDGLPATYDEFFKLCERIKIAGVSPVSWAGKVQRYVNMLLASLWSDYEGLEDLMLNYNFKGMANNLVESIQNGQVTFKDPLDINNSNGYELYQQAGKYYALKFVDTIIKNNYYSKLSFNNAQTHTMAQADFLYSDKQPGNEKIAMHLDGCWWENEATPVFDEMASIPNSGKMDRKFAFMPLPKATEDKVGQKTTLIDTHMSATFINANIKPEKIELAKLFVKFCHTNESLAEFTTTTGVTRGFNYDITEEQYNSLSYYSQSLYDLRSRSDIGRPFSNNELYKNNQGAFFHTDGFYSKVDIMYNVPSLAFKDKGLTAEQYFAGMKDYYTKSYWDGAYSKFY